MQIILYILIYVIVIFVILRLIIPHFEFGKDPLLGEIPITMAKEIEDLKNKANTKKEFLELAYNYVGDKYHNKRFDVFIKFNYLFKNLDEIWKMNGYIPCTQSSFVLRLFLIKSGFFKEDEVRRKHMFCNFIIHQYLEVKLDNKWVSVDVGEKQNGMEIGKHLKYIIK